MGEKAGKYELLEQISETNVSTVCHARREGRDFALKFALKGENYLKNKKILLSSAEVQKRLDHPNIIKVNEICCDENLFVVMEHFPHPNLEQFLEKNKVTFGTGLDILLLTADAIQYAHQNNATHGDIHPRNILVAYSLNSPIEVKVTDFGYNPELDPAYVANSLDSSAVKQPFHQWYLAPEQQKDSKPSKSADAYAFGLVARKIWTGLDPPPAMKLPSEENKELSEATDIFFKMAIEEEPGKRAGITELRNILMEIKREYDVKLENPLEIIVTDPTIDVLDFAKRRFEQDNIKEAESAYEVAAKLYPNDPEILECLIYTYVDNRKTDLAVKMIKAKKEKIRNWKELLAYAVKAGLMIGNRTARKHIKFLDRETLAELPLGIYGKAEAARLRKGPEEAVHNNLGVYHALMGEIGQAIISFEKSKTQQAFHNLGLLYLSLEENGKAIMMAQESLKKDKTDSGSRGIIIAASAKTGLAILLKEKAVPALQQVPFSDRVSSKYFAEELMRGVKPKHYVLI